MNAEHETAPADDDGVAWVQRLMDSGDYKTIEKMVKLWKALEQLGMLGDLLRRAAVWFLAIAGFYIAFSGYFADWIRSIK